MVTGRGAEDALAAEKLKGSVEEVVLGPDVEVRLQTNHLRVEVYGVSPDDDRTDIQERFEREDVPLSRIKLNW